ncbi:NUDIX hydrolase, partial [Actinomadura livida]
MSPPSRPRRPRVLANHTADLVILTIRNDQLKILLVVRGSEPFRGRLALPGGFLRPGEDLESTARRELAEETGLEVADLPLLQLHTYSLPDRDPRGRVITTAFLAIAPDLPEVEGATDAYSADWVEFHDSLREQLAFDHWTIVSNAMDKVMSELEYTPLSTSFCASPFTMSELRRVFELVWKINLDPGNFRRKVCAISDFIEPIGQKRRSSDGGRPPDLYRRGKATRL